MNQYYKNFFLNLIFFSIVTSQFTNCELHNSTLVPNPAKDEKAICRNKPSKDMAPWKQILLRFTVFYSIMFVTLVGSNIINEWKEGRRLSLAERQLEMVNVNLAGLLALALYGDLIFCSPQDKNVEDEQNKTTQTESSCVLQA